MRDRAQPPARTAARPGRVAAAALAIAALVVLAYLPSFGVPFLLDDDGAIVENLSIRGGPFSAPAWQPPPGGKPTSSRPVVNASFAANYAIGGIDRFSYHLVNLCIHLVNAALLAVVVAQLFRSPALRARFGARAVPLALWIAALWALQPICALAVSYLSQRAESLASMLYLCCIGSWLAGCGARERRSAWMAASIAFSALGMATKEIAFTAPIAALALEWAFFREPGRRASRSVWLGRGALVATWGVLFAVLGREGFARGGTVGAGTISVLDYLRTQFVAVPLYLAKILAPLPITFDHGVRLIDDPVRIGAAALAWLAIAAAGVAMLRAYAWRAALVSGLFFLLLAPTSSFVPLNTQTMAEHRVYLASAAIIALAVVLVDSLARPHPRARRALPLLGFVAVLCFAARTWSFNRLMSDEVALWRDVIRQVPSNGRAHCSLGNAFVERGDQLDAITAFDACLEIEPKNDKAFYNRANAYSRVGNREAAKRDYLAALEIRPAKNIARNNLAVLLREMGEREESRRQLELVTREDPLHASAWYNLALVRSDLDDRGGAVAALQKYLELRPDSAKGWARLGDLRRALGDGVGASEAYGRAFRASRGPDASADPERP